jgi:hypothetical protein
VEGSSVLVCADGLSAFRRERVYRGFGYRPAVAVWSVDGGVTWRRVPDASLVRPDPVPPPQAVGVVEWWRRRGRNRLRFRRRRPRTGEGYPS